MRIAHLTDIHLRQHLYGTAASAKRRSRAMVRLLPQALANITEQDVDLLAITGDLLDAPSWLMTPPPGFIFDDVEPWREAAVADYRLIKSMLDESGLRYTVLPGNHDAADLMWQVFDETAGAVEVAGHRVIRFCDFEHVGHVPRRYLPTRLRFEDELDADGGLPQVHLQHYVIAPKIEANYPYNYAEHDYLAQRIGASGRVRLSLSGHCHRGSEPMRVGSTTFAVTPAFGEWPHPWRVYEVDGDDVTHTDHALGDPASPSQAVVFLDRDGVINDRPSYRAGPEAMVLLPGAAAGIRRLNDAGRAVVIATNQNGVGRGFVPASVVNATHDRMCRLLHDEAGAHIDAIYAAHDAGPNAIYPEYVELTHSKPAPTMLLEAREHVRVNLDGAWMIGDNITDAQAAAAAGVKPILVRTGHGIDMAARFADAFPGAPIVDDLAAAVEHILGVGAQPAPHGSSL